MIRSMTGYGRAQEQIDGRDILVEIKSVNSRYLEQNVRIGRNYTYLEEELKSLVKSRISRGKAEIAVSINLVEGKKADILVNDEIVRGYIDAMNHYNATAGSDYVLAASGCVPCGEAAGGRGGHPQGRSLRRRKGDRCVRIHA